MTRNLYRTTLRPAGFATLPANVSWKYVEAPAMHGLMNWREDIPQSRHLYGVIETNRPLTDFECRHFDIVAVSQAVDQTDQGPQPVISGCEHSARQAMQAREDQGHGRIRPKKPQQDPGGLFAPIESAQPTFNWEN